MRGRDEKDVSTEQNSAEANTRVSCKNGDPCRAQSACGTQEKRPPRSNSLKFKLSRADFVRLKREGKRFTGQVCCFSFLISDPLQHPRLGLTVTKKYGKAHDRNRFKRLCKEAFRTIRTTLPKGIEINIAPILQSTAITFGGVKNDFQKFLSKTQ